MGVYIKGMKMPKNCLKCEIRSYDANAGEEYCPFSQIVCLSIGIQDNCPLVEVPEPHGRLIDAEKLKNEYPHDTDWDYPVNTNCYVCESIDNASTVIEAEGE